VFGYELSRLGQGDMERIGRAILHRRESTSQLAGPGGQAAGALDCLVQAAPTRPVEPVVRGAILFAVGRSAGAIGVCAGPDRAFEAPEPHQRRTVVAATSFFELDLELPPVLVLLDDSRILCSPRSVACFTPRVGIGGH
jgi:hypothetical protein